MRALTLLALPFVSVSCSIPPATVWVTLELPEELASSAPAVQVLPRIAEAERKLGQGRVALRLKRAAGKVQVIAPGACPLSVDLEVDEPVDRREKLHPLFDFGGKERWVGLDRDFEVRARGACPEAERARVQLSVVAGAALSELRVSGDGRSLRARTASATALGLAPTPTPNNWGIQPVSARWKERGRSELQARVTLPDGSTLVQTLGILALARASGLPNVAVQHPALFAARELTLTKKPPGSDATLRRAGSLFELVPDLDGLYQVQDEAGRLLSLKSGRYDETPLDCGRSDCHREIAQSAQRSPMTLSLESDLGGCHSLSKPECAIACHATGEPGTNDGGFGHVARELGLGALPNDYADLPRALRRLGGVGCLACHGPGAVPEEAGRWAILRSDVCAVCHDAPPRYGHVAALAASAMGRADADERARTEPACARCHTTWGSLGRPAPPAEAPPFGIACASCHDVHPHHEDPRSTLPGPATMAAPSPPASRFTEPGLLRNVALPATLPDPPASFSGPSRVCVGCHSPTSSTLRPEASAAAIVAGRGGLDPETGAPIALAPVHGIDKKGCLSCHNSGPESLERGRGHAFVATLSSCTPCHAQTPRRNADVSARALALFAQLDSKPPTPGARRPPHASEALVVNTPQKTRALRNLLLVLEDPAADVHHPAYANALLDSAERLTLGAPP